ncbi:MAG: hypothetical protein ABF310_04780 [Paracoccaceae bacterium]|jgi:hypothetical protein
MVNGKLVLVIALVLMVGGPIYIKYVERTTPVRKVEKLDASVIFGKKDSSSEDERAQAAASQ